MRRLSFILTILGTFLLLISLNFPNIKKISSKDEITKFTENQKIMVSGRVIKETFSKKYKTIYLNNSLKLSCDLSCPNYINKEIIALTKLKRFNENEYLQVLKIQLLKD